MNSRERTPTRDELLAMAFVDDELSEEGARSFEARLREEPALAREVTELRRLELMARQAAPSEPMDHEWARLRGELVHREGSRLGWIALFLGALGLYLWLVFELGRSDMPLIPKVLILAILGGLTLLLGLTLRARLRTMPYDAYTGVQR